MTSGTWDRHRGHEQSYDVVGLGFNYRIDEPRAALLTSRFGTLQKNIANRRRLVHRYRDALTGIPGLVLPYRAQDVDTSSCYVMPVALEDPGMQGPLRDRMLGRRVQTSLLYPAIHEFSAYAATQTGAPLSQSELVARTEVTIPLYPHLTERDQDRVITALIEQLAELQARAPRAASL
jgi:dTDP-4-amino-4,6-dideoxygalactose transaminase